MSEHESVAPATETVVGSTPVAPPNPAGDQQGSTPAPVDTTASGQAEPAGNEPDKQSRRDSRAFATLRRENRELYRRLGGLEAMLEQRASQAQPPAEGEPPPQQRQTRAPEIDAGQAELNRSILERIEDAGEEFDDVIEKITNPSFPFSTAMRDYLATSDKPADLAKALADNPKEAFRISMLGERAADRAMEKMEAGLKAAPKSAPRSSNAPPPVPTVGGRSTPNFDPDKASMDEYAAHWKARQAKG